MKVNLFFTNKGLIFTFISFLYIASGFSQCSILGLDPTYCVSDPAVTLTGDPGGGAFSGPGMSGSSFSPAGAGVGTHTITYEISEGGTGDKYYIKSNIGNPWGSIANNQAMDLAFGPGAWTLEAFETVDVATVFSGSTGFIFIDGSDGQASELNTFLLANLPAIEDWVNGGGRLLMNSAPNEGGDMDFGFDGTTLNYIGVPGTHVNDVEVADLAHPAYIGPNVPTATLMSGTYFGHSIILGTGYTTVLNDVLDDNRIVLCEKLWGAGKVMMGGMTTANFHTPLLESTNYLANVLVYLYGEGGGEPCIITQDVEVTAAPDVTITASPEDVCEGESVIFTVGGADSYTWSVPGITPGVPYFPDFGTTDVTVTGFDISLGCDNSATVTVNVHAIPEPDFGTTEEDYCEGDPVSFTNLTTIADGASMTYSWDFGDGTTSTTFAPTHTFPSSGPYTVTLEATSEFGCSETIVQEIFIHDIPIPDFEFSVAGFSSADGATGGCISNPVIFDNLSTIIAPDEITMLVWYFGDGASSTEFEPEHTYTTPGTYTINLIVGTEFGCNANYTMTIVMTEGLSLDIISNEPTCFGFTDGSITVGVEGAFGDLVFSITDADGTDLNGGSNTANELGEGWYYIEVSDESACTGIDSVYFNEPEEIDIDLTVTNPACYGDLTGWARVDSVYNSTGNYDAIGYNWAPNPAGNNGLGADSTWLLTEGDYTLTIVDENGCSKGFDFSIANPDSLYFTELDHDPAYCRLFDYQNGNGVLKVAAGGGTPAYNYLWTNLETGATEDNTTWGGRNPGTYEITVTDAAGCTLTSIIEMDSLNPQADFEMTSPQFTSNYQGTAPLDVHFTNTSLNYSNPNSPSGQPNFLWNFDHDNIAWVLTHDVAQEYDTTYGERGGSYDIEVCLKVTNKNGCEDMACKIINVFDPIAISNVNIFTPNGDGKNDTFTFIERASSISEFYCVIVDRWGVQVGEINNIADGWDGTDKSGSACNDGVYFYTYTAKTDNGTTLTGQGTVQILGTEY